MKQLNSNISKTIKTGRTGLSFIANTRNIFCAFALLTSTTIMAETYYVKTGGDDLSSGLSWENAHATLKTTVGNATSGDQIFVAQGTYQIPAAISMKEGVNVYGGFAGTETALAERPSLAYGKTQDGNATVLIGGGSERILTQSGQFTTETTWDGFVIQQGKSIGDGGGVYLSSRGILNNATLTNNTAGGKGGGIYCNYYSKVSNCLIINNKSNGEGGGIAAGRDNSRTIVINCLVTNNTAIGEGGGISCQFADIINCTVTNNHSNNNGGGMYVYSNRPLVTNCIVWNNTKTTVGTTGAQINGNNEGNTVAASSYIATLGTYVGQGSNKITLATTNTGTDGGIYPAFANPATIIGYTADATEIEAIFAADWRLTENSACKDAGTPDSSALNLPETDLAGNSRIINNRIDMGAFEIEKDFIISPGGSRTYDDYNSGNFGNIVFESDDANGAGQLTGIPSDGFTVNGLVKLVKTFTPKQWYALSFPFDVKHINGNFSATSHNNIPLNYDLKFYEVGKGGDIWVKDYNAPNFIYTQQVNANAGYIFQFPTAFEDVEVSSISGFKVQLKKETFSPLGNNRQLLANPSCENMQTQSSGHYYLYDSGTNVFKLAATGTVIKPFESFIWDASASSTSSIISVDGTVTELDKSIDIDSNDPLIAIRYYNLQGVEVQQPQENGIYLIKKIYASQKTETLKIFYNKQKK